MDSDSESERDRRAYGQYASLAAEGDSDIDEEAASYLRSVRDEARLLPDVFVSPAQKMRQSTPMGSRESIEHKGAEMPRAAVQAGPQWIEQFMANFLQLRTGLQRLQLSEAQPPKDPMETGSDRICQPAEEDRSTNVGGNPAADNPLASVSSLLALDREAVASRLEEEIERISMQGRVDANDVYRIYGLSAVLDYPLMASTEASMVQLLRSCKQLRSPGCSETMTAYLDILETLAGAYFGQDMDMRSTYREHGVHI